MDFCAPPNECTSDPYVVTITEPSPVDELPNTGMDTAFLFAGLLLVVLGVVILLGRRKVVSHG